MSYQLQHTGAQLDAAIDNYVDTSDADAVVGDILSNKTAYVNKIKLTGTCAYDANTSDGTAAVGDILSGKTAYVDGSKLTGTMTDRSGDTACVSSSVDSTTLKLKASEGYRDGVNDNVIITDTDFAAANIKDAVNIFGIAGTYDHEATVPITAETVLIGKKGRVNGATITGTMPNNAGDVAAVSAHMGATTNLHMIPATGYTDGSDDASTIDLTTVDGDLVTGNIKSGITLFGVAGKAEVVDTTEATVPIAVGTVLNTKVGFVNGAKVTGTMPNNAGDVAAVSSHAGAAGEIHVVPAAGYTDGSDDASVITDAEFLAENIKKDVDIFGLTGTFEGGSGIESGIDWGTVNEYGQLTSVTIYGTTLPDYACYNQNVLTSVVFNDSVEDIFDGAFYGCVHLVISEFPDSLKRLYPGSFRGCAEIAVSKLPQGFLYLGENAFYNCDAIPKLWIPSSCTKIDGSSYSKSPFYGCTSTIQLYCEAASKPAGWGTYWNYYSSSGQLTVNWGITEAVYDAL
jgi:hypothetical protein